MTARPGSQYPEVGDLSPVFADAPVPPTPRDALLAIGEGRTFRSFAIHISDESGRPRLRVWGCQPVAALTDEDRRDALLYNVAPQRVHPVKPVRAVVRRDVAHLRGIDVRRVDDLAGRLQVYRPTGHSAEVAFICVGPIVLHALRNDQRLRVDRVDRVADPDIH